MKKTELSLNTNFDRIRGIAACLVVLTHASAQWLDASCTDGLPALFFAQLCSILSFAGITLFVMLSGAIYLAPAHKDKSCSVRFMSRRAVRFLLLYCFWKLFYLAENLLLHPELLQKSTLKEALILAFFRTNGKYHLWYLPMFAFLLLLVPILYEGAQRRSACTLYLALFIPAAVVLPNAFLYEFPFKYLLLDARNLFDLNHFLGYLGYFLLGHVLAEDALAGGADTAGRFSGTSLLLWAGAAVSFAAALFKSVSCSAGQTAAYTSLATPFSVHILLLASALFRMLCRSRSEIALSIAARRLPRASFGIYLLHPFFLDLLQKRNLIVGIRSPFIGIPVLWAALTALSLTGTLLLKRIPGIRRVL